MSTSIVAGVAAVAWLAHGPGSGTWHLAHWLPFVASVLFASTRGGGIFARWALTSYLVALATWTLLAGFGIGPLSDAPRVALYTANPNLLAADLVSACLVLVALRPRWPWAAMLPVLIVAVTMTGSRTALAAALFGLGVYLALGYTTKRVKVIAAAATAVAAVIVGIAFVQVIHEEALPNRLHATTTFASRYWATNAQEFVVERAVEPGPTGTGRADRIRATALDEPAAIYQWVERSIDDTPYTASVYLRSAQPTTVQLRTVFSQIDCSVTPTWSRCTTPPGTGNGTLWVQFRIQSREPDGELDVVAYGPQIEHAEAPSAYAPKGAAWLETPTVRRLIPNDGTISVSSTGRLISMRSAWAAFTESPWLGHGRTAPFDVITAASSEASDPLPESHSHNLVLESLMRDGVLGALGWLLVGIFSLGVLRQAFGRAALPWAVAITVLNAIDMTLLHSGSFYSLAILIGIGFGAMREGTSLEPRND